MNGGNTQRGQADGFGLEILSKLRDVKVCFFLCIYNSSITVQVSQKTYFQFQSKDSSVTLLHFIVRTYIFNSEEGINTPLPIPEPGDIGRASFILFEDVTAELETLQKQWNSKNCNSLSLYYNEKCCSKY